MKKFLSAALAVLTLLSMFSITVSAESVNPTDAVLYDEASAETISVYVTAQNDGKFILPKTEIVIPANYADCYGISGKGDYSALDALVAANAVIDSKLTPDNISDYIEFSESGFLTKVFGVETSSFGFTVNGEQPHDDTPVTYPGMPESYTGYTITDAEIKNGDSLEFYFYLDEYAMDNYAWFENTDGERLNTVSAAEGDTVVLQLVGYTIGWYGCAVKPEAFYEPLSEAVIYVSSNDDSGFIPVDMTDDDGFVGVKFEKEGVYVVSALHDTTDEYATPIVMPYLIVAVGEEADASDIIDTVEAPIPSKIPKPGEGEVLSTITAPEGATVFIGYKTKNTHFIPFDEIKPAYVEDGTYYYLLKKNQPYNYRISGAGLTAAAKFTAKEGECDFTFTEEDLGGDPKQIIRKDGYYEANILFNLSLSNSVKMSVGDTFDLVAMRTWQTVDTVINNYFFEPDFTYTVHGDSVTVSDDGVITAVKDGTSFVTVTYDAFRSNGHLYSAIFPENTGVFAVTVGDGFAESPITTDSELCPIFYLENDGAAKYTFSLPEETAEAKVSLLSPKLDDKKVDYGEFEFSDTGVEIDGANVTLTLPEGRNIVKIESEKGTAYHVLTVRPIKMYAEITKKADETTAADEICEGDTVKVTFEGLSAPVPKLSGVYNYSNQIFFTDENGTEIKAASAQYNFITNGNTMTFTVPEGAFEDGAYVLGDGYIKVKGWGDPIGEGHRAITRRDGKNPNFRAEAREFNTGIFPTIIIKPDGINAKTPEPTLTVKTPCKTVYNVGDTFDTTGLVLEYTDENYNKTEITEGFTVSAAEPLKRSDKTVTVTYGELSAEIAISVRAKTSSDKTISVKVAVRGDYVHGDEKHVGKYPVWIKAKTVKLPKGSCVYDALEKVLGDNGYVEIGGSDNYISYIITPDGTKIGEFTNGEMSGWMYTVNNVIIEAGVLDCELKNGDKVALFYTDDYNEIWKNAWSSGGSHSSTVVKTDEDGKTVSDDKNDDKKVDDKKDDTEDQDKKDDDTKEDDNTKDDDKKDDAMGGETKTEVKLPFEDVAEDKWYTPYVKEMYEKQYISGKSETSFDPDGSIKRCEMIKILALCSGAEIDKYSDKETFTDVAKDSWYHGFVEWGSDEKLINGIGEGLFAPEKTITREDAAVIICRFAKLGAGEKEAAFTDAENISAYALDSVKAVTANGIMSGFPDGSFGPKAELSRAQFCKILSEVLKTTSKTE